MNKSSKTSRLRDNSWIRKVDEEDEAVDKDPNFGRSILNRYKTNETPASSQGDEIDNSGTTTAVQALSKRYSGSQNELKSSTTTTKTTKDGTTTETTITTTQNVSSPVSKTSTKTETFTEKVKSSSKGPQYSNYSPTRTTKVTETTVMSNKDAEDKLYDSLIPSSIKDNASPNDSKTGFSKTDTVVVKSSGTNAEDKLYDDFTNGTKTISSTQTVTVRSSTNGADDPYDSLVFKDPTFNLSNSLSRSSVTKREVVTVESSGRGYTDDIPSSRTTSYTISTNPSTDRTYSYSRTDSSPSVYSSSSYRSNSRSDENLSDPIYSKTSIKSVYASPERPVLEKDLCTSCRKPFTADAKIVLEDMKINCHASCFKCDVCKSTLGHLKAGDSMWIYKSRVHCENCFENTRDKWRR